MSQRHLGEGVDGIYNQEVENKRPKKGKEKENLQQHRPKKKRNVPKEMTEMRTKTTSLPKNQVVRTHHTS